MRTRGKESGTDGRFHFVAAGLVFLLALGLRLALTWQTAALPEFRTPTPGKDIDVHWQAAQELRRLDLEGPNFALQTTSAPGHVAFLALGQMILGESLSRQRVLVSVLGAVSVLLIYWTTWSITRDRWAAVISGLASASLPSLVYFHSMLLKTSLGLPLLALLLALVCRPRAVRHWPVGFGLLVGVVLALLYENQRNTLLYPLVVICCLVLNPLLPRAGRLRAVLAMLAVFSGILWGVAAAPKLLGLSRPVFLPVGGVHVRVGFHAGANGTYHALDGVPGLPYGHAFVSRLRAEAALGRRLSPREADAYYLAESARFIREQPREALTLVRKKIAFFFSNYEIQGNQQFDQVIRDAPLLGKLPLRYGSLLVLAVWGGIALWTQGRWRFLVPLLGVAGAVLLANLLTFVTWRYRIHVVVPMLVLSGPGVVFAIRELIALGRSGALRWRPVARFGVRILLPAAVAALVAFRPVDPAMASAAARWAPVDARLSEQAEDAIAKLAQPARPGAPALDEARKVVLLIRLRQHSTAFARIEEMLARGRFDPLLLAPYVTYLAWLGDSQRAEDLLSRLEQEAPEKHTAVQRRLDPLVRTWLDIGLEAAAEPGAPRWRSTVSVGFNHGDSN